MKKIILALIICISLQLHAQRYLTFVYPVIDSTMAGVYGTATDYLAMNQNLLFDFYEPHLDTAQKRPLIIYTHGGGFTSGTRSYPSVKLLCRKMAMKGYAVATIDYRLDPNFLLYSSTTNRRAMTDAMHDLKQAIRYFKANAALLKIDTTRIIIGGESAGAISAMMASYVDKQIEMAPYPMASPNNPVGSINNATYGNGVKATLCLCGMILDTTAIENASNPPILWTHGSADTFIPISLAFNTVLRAAHIGLPIQTKLYQGATHCPWYYGNPNWQLYLDSTITDITTFLYSKVTTPVGLTQLQKEENTVSLFPNPTKNNITILLNNTLTLSHIRIMDITGKNILSEKINHSASATLYTEGLAQGIYIVEIKTDTSIIYKKFIKE